MLTPYFHYALQRTDFSADEQHASLRKACPRAGAIVTFTGLVRDSINQASPDKKGNIQSIELDTYESMSKKQMQQIGETAFKSFDIHGLTIIHRFGSLKPEDQIVFVGTASKHRLDAFAAAEMTMDFLKSKIAFWKKEIYLDSTPSRWIEPTPADHTALKKWQK